MHDESVGPKLAVWTIGHSNHPPEVFFDLLAKHRIELLVDVRSSPYSRYAAQFNRDALGPALNTRNVRYLFLGDLLGGRAEDEQFRDELGHVLYDRLARSAGFQQGIRRLWEEAIRRRTAILCGEENPADCHRRLLVGRVLAEQGAEIIHIRGDGRTQTEAELSADELYQKTKGQLSLFETEDPAQWKSTRSVLPRNQPPSSSARCDGLEFGD